MLFKLLTKMFLLVKLKSTHPFESFTKVIPCCLVVMEYLRYWWPMVWLNLKLKLQSRLFFIIIQIFLRPWTIHEKGSAYSSGTPESQVLCFWAVSYMCILLKIFLLLFNFCHMVLSVYFWLKNFDCLLCDFWLILLL